ncbi:MAG: RdgB/HAM1 family non-canonical purine NTP pyrophosphatase [Sulfurimonas sp.]|nr:RdgB/HAM1 family non-canonical purine NTP pyrophosphatase [Sulfurimonas sp.]
MKLVLATSNKGKVKEIKALCEEYEVIAYSELIDEFEIIEDADSFKENALIKARAVYKALKDAPQGYDKNLIVIADDSGISVDILNGAPGIYSARYGGINANDKENLNKLMQDIKSKGVKSSPAHYTASIAIVTKNGEYSVHGWMYGEALTEAIGDGGFGYDPMFIPLGFDKTLGELDDEVKKKLSHRSKALDLAKKIIKSF